jgi:hypothetical protein
LLVLPCACRVEWDCAHAFAMSSTRAEGVFWGRHPEGTVMEAGHENKIRSRSKEAPARGRDIPGGPESVFVEEHDRVVCVYLHRTYSKHSSHSHIRKIRKMTKKERERRISIKPELRSRSCDRDVTVISGGRGGYDESRARTREVTGHARARDDPGAVFPGDGTERRYIVYSMFDDVTLHRCKIAYLSCLFPLDRARLRSKACLAIMSARMVSGRRLARRSEIVSRPPLKTRLTDTAEPVKMCQKPLERDQIEILPEIENTSRAILERQGN